MKKRKFKFKEVTPKSFKCGIGACPAIFEMEDKFVIIGAVADEGIRQKLKKKIAKHEAVIVIPKDLLLNLKQ